MANDMAGRIQDAAALACARMTDGELVTLLQACVAELGMPERTARGNDAMRAIAESETDEGRMRMVQAADAALHRNKYDGGALQALTEVWDDARLMEEVDTLIEFVCILADDAIGELDVNFVMACNAFSRARKR